MTDLKSSGAQEKFSTGSVRDTQEGKPRYHLISPLALRRLAIHMAKGAAKYGDRNWEKGQDTERTMESLMRHLEAVRRGDTDEDHEAALLFNVMSIVHTREAIKLGLLPASLDNMVKYQPVVYAQPRSDPHKYRVFRSRNYEWRFPAGADPRSFTQYRLVGQTIWANGGISVQCLLDDRSGGTIEVTDE
jgi:hypothetical protein